MLTDFGRFLRKIRIDHGEILKEMADKLGVTASYLSAIETGKRAIPEKWGNIIAEMYNLNEEEKRQLRNAEDSSVKNIRIELGGFSNLKKETALVFARQFENMDDTTAEKINKILNKQSKE